MCKFLNSGVAKPGEWQTAEWKEHMKGNLHKVRSGGGNPALDRMEYIRRCRLRGTKQTRSVEVYNTKS